MSKNIKEAVEDLVSDLFSDMDDRSLGTEAVDADVREDWKADWLERVIKAMQSIAKEAP